MECASVRIMIGTSSPKGGEFSLPRHRCRSEAITTSLDAEKYPVSEIDDFSGSTVPDLGCVENEFDIPAMSMVFSAKLRTTRPDPHDIQITHEKPLFRGNGDN
ncbi:uncharacterized protein ATNIH1004_001956 [Aspergillus tanneri]|uniref:Uncharacterized protein n=1 Tax=Aspergillus tanneri TaxID=1220188 RepID=A0A5M9M7P7_9EURO|nr:uncharacterized protein ATNIH1004_001956 [Aspergillus tanneri]KAA8641354.1 hypothetical protein ATNIH1004_001956 [Aspergillus tanneri]